MSAPYWQTKSLDELTQAEWESLCDGCGKCCLLKLEDEDTGRVYYTDVACKLLDCETCRCTDYENRTKFVPDCVVLDVSKAKNLDWLPSTCAYRLRANNEPLPGWHPLVCGDPEMVHKMAVSVRDRVLTEGDVAEEDLEDRIVYWPE